MSSNTGPEGSYPDEEEAAAASRAAGSVSPPAPPLPPTLNGNDPVKSTRRPNRKLALGLIGGGAIIVIAALIAGGVFMATRPTAIQQASDACNGTEAFKAAGISEETAASLGDSAADYLKGVLSVEDGGKTLIVQTKPQDDDPLGISTVPLDCIEKKLGMPSWLTESISTTRALDGRQHGEWDGFSAQWGYHPDNGLNLIIVTK